MLAAVCGNSERSPRSVTEKMGVVWNRFYKVEDEVSLRLLRYERKDGSQQIVILGYK